MTCSHLLPVLLITQTSLLLQPLKLLRHAYLRHQGEDALGQPLVHQLICEACGQSHQLTAG